MSFNFGKIGKIVSQIIGGLASVIGIWQGYEYAINKDEIDSSDRTEITTPLLNTTVNKTTDPPKKTTNANPTIKKVSYFNSNEKLPGGGLAILLVTPQKRIDSDLQFSVSDFLIKKGISNSTTLLESSVPYYNDFMNASNSWLNQIKLKEHTSSYLIGQTSEEVTKSTANQKITVVNLSFSGRIVKLNPYRVIPIRIQKKGSSFNRMDAFSDTYSSLAKGIADEISLH